MVSQTSKIKTKRAIPVAEFTARIAKRKTELGIVEPAHPELVEGRNNGKRRTEGKKALLKAIEDLGGKW